MSLATLGLAADGLRRVCDDHDLLATSVERLDLYGPGEMIAYHVAVSVKTRATTLIVAGV